MTLARDAIKLALLGDGRPVDWWGLPTRLEWARIPDRGILGYQTGSLTLCVAFGRPQRSWVQELKPSSPARFLLVVEAGGRSPGRSLDLTIQRLTDACRIHAVIRRHRPFWAWRLRICYMGINDTGDLPDNSQKRVRSLI